MVENSRYMIVFLVVILSLSMVSASFSVGNHSLTDVYGISDNIKGWVNLSFDNEPEDSIFKDSRSNEIKLIDLLKKRNSYSYTCSPSDCLTDYDANNGEISKTFYLNRDEFSLFGLKFSGENVLVNSATFQLQSDAPAECVNQIEVDILNDDIIEVTNNKIWEGLGCSSPGDYGCYSSGENTVEYGITTTPYCQRINLSKAPGFNIGAWVKNVSGSLELEMSLYDSFNSEKADCLLPDPTSSGGEIFCNVSYSVLEPSEHYVCIKSVSGSGNYKVRANSDPSQLCGFYGSPILQETAAYQIFAEGRKFDAVGTIDVSDSLPDGNLFKNLINDYISDRYQRDCSNGCVVPIRFNSGAGQQITINNLLVNYEEQSGTVDEDRFYDLSEVPAKITSGFQKIYLDGGDFIVPGVIGRYNFLLKLENSLIFSEWVNVSNVTRILSLSPLSTASSYPTLFSIKTSSPSNVTRYLWEFGDGETSATTENRVTHTYDSIGNYELKMIITDFKNFDSEKTFTISVNSPRDLINTTLFEIKNNIKNIKNYSANLNLFSQKSIASALNLEFAELEIVELEDAYNNATNEAEYNAIITNLVKLKIPKEITKSNIAESISFIPDKQNVDMNILQTISGENYDLSKESEYIDAVLLWNLENLETKMDFTEFSGSYENFVEPILNVFEMTIKERKDLRESYFLVLPKLDNLEFDSSTVSVEEGDYVYVDLSGKSKISFSTTEDVNFADLPAFISPGIDSLSVINILDSDEEKKKSKLTIFILAISLLVIVAFIAYVILQEWYKKKYENYLFKNKNDLFNMVNYVNNSKKKGLKNKEISENLSKAKWGSEQVRYVMKKYAGKRTGMFELPLTNLITKFKNGDSQKTR